MTEQIEQVELVRVSGWPMGMKADGEPVGLPGLALVSWKHPPTERVFQVYVNGALAAVSESSEPRRLLVAVDPTTQAVIEVLAVDAVVRNNDFSNQLSGFNSQDGSRVQLVWQRQANDELDSIAVIFSDNGSGVIDYIAPLAQVALWDERAEKWGFGLGGFGNEVFGYSDSGGVGFGEGCFGEGEFGFDVKRLTYTTEPLALGAYKFGLRVKDGAGHVNEAETVAFEVFVDPLPLPGQLAIGSYDDVNDRLVLNII